MPRILVRTSVVFVKDNGNETELASSEREVSDEQVTQSFLSLAMAQTVPASGGMPSTPVITSPPIGGTA